MKFIGRRIVRGAIEELLRIIREFFKPYTPEMDDTTGDSGISVPPKPKAKLRKKKRKDPTKVMRGY